MYKTYAKIIRDGNWHIFLKCPLHEQCTDILSDKLLFVNLAIFMDKNMLKA